MLTWSGIFIRLVSLTKGKSRIPIQEMSLVSICIIAEKNKLLSPPHIPSLPWFSGLSLFKALQDGVLILKFLPLTLKLVVPCLINSFNLSNPLFFKSESKRSYQATGQKNLNISQAAKTTCWCGRQLQSSRFNC